MGRGRYYRRLDHRTQAVARVADERVVVSWARVAVAVLIALVWAVIMLADVFSQEFVAPDFTSAALGLVAYLFGSEFKKAAANGR